MIAGVVLAAGPSSRFGDPKPLQPIAGAPMLTHVVETAFQSALDEILVVVGPDADRIRGEVALPRNARFIVNLDHPSGIAGSIVAGVEATDPTADAVVVMHADQPTLSPVVVRAIVRVYQETSMPVVRACFADAPAGTASGAPALISAGIWDDLHALEGDDGLPAFLAANPDLIEDIHFRDAAPIDVDTPEDLQRVLTAWPVSGTG